MDFFKLKELIIPADSQFIHNANAASQPILVLGKSRGTSTGSYTVVQSRDYLGTLSFQGADGDDMIEGARIDAVVAGSWQQ